MDKKYTYKYDKESRIMHKQHFGSFTIEAIIDSWDDGIEQGLVHSDVRSFLLDYTDAKLDLKFGSADKMVAYFNARPHLFKRKKIAVVVNTPENVVHPILAQAKPKNYSLAIFSTQLAANTWLMS